MTDTRREFLKRPGAGTSDHKTTEIRRRRPAPGQTIGPRPAAGKMTGGAPGGAVIICKQALPRSVAPTASAFRRSRQRSRNVGREKDA